MSEAPFLMASIRTRLTSFTTGASSAARATSSTSSDSAACDLDIVLADRADDLLERGPLLGVVALDGLSDGDFGGHHRLDVVAGDELQIVDGEDVGRVGHRHDERGTGPVHRDDEVLLRDVLRDELDDLRVDVEVFEIDGRNAVLLRQEVGELVLLDGAGLDERGANPRAGPLLFFLGLPKLLDGDQVLADEELTEPTGHTCVLSRVAYLGRSRTLVTWEVCRGERGTPCKTRASEKSVSTGGMSHHCARRLHVAPNLGRQFRYRPKSLFGTKPLEKLHPDGLAVQVARPV